MAKTTTVTSYQDDFDNSQMIDCPADIIAANDMMNEGDQINEILLTHPLPYKVEYLTDGSASGQEYFKTQEEAEEAKTNWLET
jgi:hypothetical protein|tara:strand:+ start:319 stop:567 length:249 start_codon:yes stop_codon:yes gene_type:complete